MKNPFLTAAALAVMLSLNACSYGPSGGSAGKDADVTTTENSSVMAVNADDCDEPGRLPGECDPSCRSRACREALLKKHFVEDSDTLKYTRLHGPFVFTDLSFDGLLKSNACDANFYFEISRQTTGEWYGNVFVNRYTHDDARLFPLPLMKVLYAKYRKDFSQINFYWLESSPRCPKGKDVLMKIILQNGDHAFYNVSSPPVASQRIPGTPELDRTAVPQSAP